MGRQLMSDLNPALALIENSAERKTLIRLVQEAEERGFSGLFIPSIGDYLDFCREALQATSRISIATSIAPIYHQPAHELSRTATEFHNLFSGRFRLGLGVSHASMLEAAGIRAGRPLSDMRDYVAALRDTAAKTGAQLPPIYLATLRDKMLRLAHEIADGAIYGTGVLSNLPSQLVRCGIRANEAFFVGNMIPTVVDDDRAAARAVHVVASNDYLMLPNYRNYWREAGYASKIDAVEDAIAAGRDSNLVDLMGDEWLADITIFGDGTRARQHVEATIKAGILPIVTPMSSTGDVAGAGARIIAALT